MESNSSNENLNLREFLGLCLSKWYLFIISVAVCLAAAAFYILKTPKEYTRTTTVLIKETAVKRPTNDLESMLSGGGMNQQMSKLSNEIVSLQSPDLMREVVKRLNLDFNYARDGRFKKAVIYGADLPAKVSMSELSAKSSFYVSPVNDSIVEISKLEYYVDEDRKEDTNSYRCRFGETVSTPAGEIVINPGASFTGTWDFPLFVSHTSIESATRDYNSRLSASAVDLKNSSDILKITITDQSKARGDDVLNTVVAIYNENWIDDRNKSAVSTSLFIDDRLAAIEKELGSVDDDISSYKSRNVIPDIAAASSMYMTQTAENTRQMQELDNQLYTVRYIRNIITAESLSTQLIPAPSIISNTALLNQINHYNDALLERNNLVASSSETNPLVINLDRNLAQMKESIITAIDNQIVTLEAQVGSVRRSDARTTSRLAENPNQAKYLLSVERQQKVKESLYLFLLEKREENELSQAFTAYNTRIITKPTGPLSPSAPQTSKIALLAFLIGLCLPAAWLYARETLYTKLRGRKDLENVKMPLIGEIPLHKSKGKKRGEKNTGAGKAVVEHGKRDVINEAFRVLRTNLEFMTKGHSHQAIIVTSFNPGSGKSFITINLAQSLAIKKTKVLVVDCDLRHASASAYVGRPKTGLSNYLVGETNDLASLIVHPESSEILDILPVGTIPPNPTELIGSPEFAKAIETLKGKYDFVLLDCPPIDIVADTQLVAEVADRTLFIVRAGLLERGMIPEIDNLYESGKYRNLSLVLNGTETETSGYGGRYHYGYRYGYHYGYHSSSYYSTDKS